jgi:hypothetical protein
MCIELHFIVFIHTNLIPLNGINSARCSRVRYWLARCILLDNLARVGARAGVKMATLFGSMSVMPVAVEKKKQRSLLPLLTVLFIFSYGLMTVLIVEQASAIESQHSLIKILMRDSTELWAERGRAITEKQMAKGKHQAAPAPQAPSTQGPSRNAPTSQGQQSRAEKAAKPEVQVPPVPAADLSDQRRSLRTI